MGMIISEHGLHFRQSAFFEDYVGSWLGRFFKDLGTAEAADFYRAVAQLGQQFLAVEQRYFSLPDN
jgi:TorA maturation chaperone TorD